MAGPSTYTPTSIDLQYASIVTFFNDSVPQCVSVSSHSCAAPGTVTVNLDSATEGC